MTYPLYIVNAFTHRTFGGNPAAVMPLEHWLSDAKLQALAAQHNLSETAFTVPVAENCYELRWFTPKAEVRLCGHATLATAHVLKTLGGYPHDSMIFQTRFSGDLAAHFIGSAIELDFPAIITEPHEVESGIEAVLGVAVMSASRPVSNPWQVLYELADEATVVGLSPDFTALAQVVNHAVIVTARGTHHDFVSRFFAPNLGIDEDPVTGSAHCQLAPWWSARLGKTELRAAQLSARGGELDCQLLGDRVRLRGECVTYAIGEVLAALD